MKTSIKIFIRIIAISFVFLSCGTDDNVAEQNNSSSSTEQVGSISSSSITLSSSSLVSEKPVRSSKVVSYKKNGTYNLCRYAAPTTSPDKEVLKSAFPNIFGTELEREECKYFAVCVVSASITSYYWLLSEDMTLYLITPEVGCGGTDDSIFSAMLVCDDTAEGNLEDIVNSKTNNSAFLSDPLSAAPRYVDPNLTCREINEDVFF